ncbi:PHB depolymerase family esterase [Aurantimonas sp. VKM B-3413]|uniref:extracellular catalytic domain type 1 short-chain-length polyhydroxyalkanoate depolymerase n=1 Tax=Aurantimonas sp. VKM B-3413 TaxID=2779401 RepID=UPI001E527A19|nr:PHB depolymerase family esterase [Aurantimonas sp. VKM B-3413]MCB8837967.1 PHB depolymerase family esterase [Aurantimonas sp. VKM B-3413]
MTYLPKIDMGEVTRLTREGRLGEAMALLRGGKSPSPAPTDKTPAGNDGKRPGDGAGPLLDLTRQSGANGGWSSIPKGFADGLAGVDPDRFAGRNSAPAIPAGARFSDHSFAGPAGVRDYKLYVPSTYDAAGSPMPLIVMLHGCTQSPDDFANGTRMNEIAEEIGFLVAYPGQSKAANMQKCWNWFEAKDQMRDAGEPALIAGITRQVMSAHAVDPRKVFVAGLSAGGAAAAIMGQRYFDLYAAVGVHSGLACGAARDMGSAFAAMRGGGPVEAGGTVVPTIVFHGDRDTTVAPVNGDRVLEQAKANAASTRIVTGGVSAKGVRYTRTVEREADGHERLECWTIHGAGHAWSGGSAAGSYTLPDGPDASREMIRFFMDVAV